jgi:hypothetical protein
MDKVASDIKDITYLLGWLAERGQKIDFLKYEAARPEKLFEAMRQLVHVSKTEGEKEILQLLGSVLVEEDRAKAIDA